MNDEYPVYVGEEFWMRLTGDKNFYFDLINAIVEVSEEIEKNISNEKDLLEDVIEKLAIEIENSSIFKEYLNRNKNK